MNQTAAFSLFVLASPICSSWVQAESAEVEAPRPGPAGIYHWDYGDAVCEDCREPAVAVVAGVFAKARKAERVSRRWEKKKLAPGYPFAAHTEELGVEKPVGIAVVLGLFENAVDARRWARRHGKGLRVVELGEPLGVGEEYDRHPLRVVRIDRRGAKAFRASEVDHVYQTLGAAKRGVEALRKLKPLCEIAAGAIFVTRNPYSADLWAPVTCNKTPAYVPITSTLFRAVVRRHQDGVRIHQIVDVECDMPYVDSWRWDPVKGRSPMPGEPNLPGPFDDPGKGHGCGPGSPY